VDLAAQQNYAPWFLGINPRGLVPVLVHDGAVHIESNDILAYLEGAFPEPRLIPAGRDDETWRMLAEEDDLHLDLRALTMRFVVPRKLAEKTPARLSAYREDGGTIGGEADPHKAVELGFWQDFARQGITDAQVRISAGKFHHAYAELEERLRAERFLLGGEISLVDIAWFIYTHRLRVAGYPFARLHPAVNVWYRGLFSRAEFSGEIKTPPPLRAITAALHASQAVRGKSLARVSGL
jgi:glutathione S-transferase